MKSALSHLCKESKMKVLDSLQLEAISTKGFVAVLDAFSLKKTLVVIEDSNLNLELSARNVKDVKVLKADGLNVYDMMNFKNVIFTEAAVKKVEGALQS
jgi:large subunit ribosomal protein L4